MKLPADKRQGLRRIKRESILSLLDLSFVKRAAARGAAPVRAANDGWHSRDEDIMGTAIRVELRCEDSRAAQAAMAAARSETHRIDPAMRPPPART